jgi:antitoxin MazE
MYIREVTMQVSKWGNSLAIRLPAAVVDVLQLQEGDDVEVIVAGERTFALKRKQSNAELLARLRKFRGRLPADFRFDRDDANARS